MHFVCTIPVLEEHRRHNIVMLKDPATRQLVFAQMWAALFGLGSAVYSFGRWSAFREALPRRLLHLLWSMYVGDGSSTDLEAAKGSGQELD